MSETTTEETISLSRRVRYRAVGDEGVLVHMESGRVLVVNEVGLHIVEALGRQAMTIAELAESVVREFEVDAASARADVAVFLQELRGEQAIDTGGAAGDGPAVG
jgi:PqqD family protein of HPr-rel-A system